jgi:hypothetical protein
MMDILAMVVYRNVIAELILAKRLQECVLEIGVN